ncbi:MAG: lysophospholipid acyltransferase family protein [Pseudomonadota bacterium]
MANLLKRWVRYPAEALLLALVFGALRLLPTDVASNIGGWFGRSLGPRMRGDAVARKNIAMAMPNLSATEVDRVIERMWDNLGRTLAEYPHLWKIASADSGRTIVRGREHVQPFLDGDSAGILLAAHQANWEVAAAHSKRAGLPLSTIVRPTNNPMVNSLIELCRGDHGHERISKNLNGAKRILGAIRAGGVVGMLADQKFNKGIELPFFGIPAPTTDAPAQLLLHTDCRVIPVQVTREGAGRFEIICYPPLEMPTGDLPRSDKLRSVMMTYHQLLEDWIRQRPAEWLWIHRRWPKERYRDPDRDTGGE